MGWEQRGNHTYYYRTHKRAGRVVKEYVGAGVTAALIAADDVAERACRREQRARDRDEARHLATLAAHYTSFARAVDALAAGALMSAGYHQHARGAWRKRRDGEAAKTT